MRLGLAVVALVGCDELPDDAPTPRTWLIPPAPLAWPLAHAERRLGRGQAPQITESLGISGDGAPLHLATPWPVPGDGPARAIVYGLDRGRQAIELVDVDRGHVIWRDEVACAAPVVGVTAEAVVCADAHGVRAVGLDGKPRWRSDATFLAMTDEHVTEAGAGEAIVVDAATGNELAHVALPAGILSDSIVASCGDAGRELFAVGHDGRLARIAEAHGGPKVVWSVGVGSVAGLDACDGASVLVVADGGLVAIARDTGKVTGRVDGVRGYWPARAHDGIEIATASGVARWGRDLVGPSVPLALPPLGELLARRGDRRLVRATPLTAALLDGSGVRAYLPLAELGAVLGDDAIVAASWLGSPDNTPRRLAIPAPWRRALRVAVHAPVAVAAELRDLPAIEPLDETHAIARPGAGMHGVAAVALDDAAVYAAALDETPGVARFELATRAWTWARSDGCGAGTVVGLAVARDLVACAVRSGSGATVRATASTGEPRWDWHGELDALDAAGDVVLVRDADRLIVLDARDGTPLATFASDDGAPVRAAALDVAGMTLVVTAERGRVVGRLPRVDFVPAWTIAVAGVVRAISPSADGVLVELEDGDAFRIDARTGDAVALPGLGLAWRAAGDVVTGETAGGPIPPQHMPTPPKVIPRPAPLHDTPESPPPIATPWLVPPLGEASWQYTLYELAGGIRARNDYALPPPVAPAAVRGPGDSPLVLEYGAGLREAIVIEPRRGDPVRRVQLPDDAPPGLAFAAIVDGKPVAGTILASPLRVVLF